MKSIERIMMAIVVLLSTAAVNAQITKAEIIATGLTCSMCSNAINKQLKAMPEVEKVLIDLNNNSFMVTLKKNTTLNPQALRSSVEKAGFFVGSMVLTMDVDNAQKNSNGFKNASGTYILVDAKEIPIKENLRLKVLNNGFVTKKEFKQSAKMLLKYSNSDSQLNTYFVKTI